MPTPGRGFLAGPPVQGSALDIGLGDISTAEETLVVPCGDEPKMENRNLLTLVSNPCRPEDTIPGRKRSLSTAALTLETEQRFVLDMTTTGAKTLDLESRAIYAGRSNTYEEAFRALPRLAHSLGKEGGQCLLSLRHSGVKKLKTSQYTFDSPMFVISVAGTTVLPRCKSQRDGLRLALEQPLEPSLLLLAAPSGSYRILWVFDDRWGHCAMSDFDVFHDLFWSWHYYVESVSCYQGCRGDLPSILEGVVDGLPLRSPFTRIDPLSLRRYSAFDLQKMQANPRG